ncbi:hypothetical protein ACFOLD_10425 [Kocuria carniphila]|uniref:FitA-like ribbon-helix-helix domain-containing protein n=1 Tax=Kocuria carniphila TaxID=262208 RepID=UPI003617B587
MTIRNLDPQVKVALQKRAAANGRSMEAEMRDILSQSVAEVPDPNNNRVYGLGTRIHTMFAELDGLEIPERPADEARAADFS